MSTTSDLDTRAKDDLRTALSGRLDEEKVAAAVEKVAAAVTAYPASGAVVSFVFYVRVEVKIQSGREFNGHAGGLSTPGAGVLVGDVYTDDLEALYANTVSFMVTATTVYTAVYFFDQGSKLLGHFQAGALSMVDGIFGGTGTWS